MTDHYGAVNNHFPVYKAILGLGTNNQPSDQTNNRVILEQACSWPVRSQSFAKENFRIEKFCAGLFWGSHIISRVISTHGKRYCAIRSSTDSSLIYWHYWVYGYYTWSKLWPVWSSEVGAGPLPRRHLASRHSLPLQRWQSLRMIHHYHSHRSRSHHHHVLQACSP